MALILLAFMASLSSSFSTVTGVYAGGFIPNTGPHIRKISGASTLFSSGNMDFYDKHLIDPTNLTQDSDLYANKEGEVDKFCYDLKIFNGWLENPETDLSKKVFTIGGMKASGDVTREAFGKRDQVYLEGSVAEYCTLCKIESP